MKNLILLAVLAFCLKSSTAQSIICPDSGVHLLPHPTYCHKYVLCNNGAPWTLECQDGLHWSEEYTNCTTPEIAECNRDMICPSFDDPNYPVIIPDVEDCEKYNVCCGGNKVSLQCGEGLHFNANTLYCDTKESAECEIDPEIDITINCPAEGVHFLPHPTDCNYFFICVPNEESSLQRCAPDTYWDAVNRRCDVRANVLCSHEIECPVAEVSFVEHPKSCSTYFMCILGTANMLTCAPNFYFDVIQGYCEASNRVVCNFQCPSEGVIWLSHPFHCNHYFICVNGTPYLNRCADTLYFDQENSRCDVAENVECPESAIF